MRDAMSPGRWWHRPSRSLPRRARAQCGPGGSDSPAECARRAASRSTAAQADRNRRPARRGARPLEAVAKSTARTPTSGGPCTATGSGRSPGPRRTSAGACRHRRRSWRPRGASARRAGRAGGKGCRRGEAGQPPRASGVAWHSAGTSRITAMASANRAIAGETCRETPGRCSAVSPPGVRWTGITLSKALAGPRSEAVRRPPGACLCVRVAKKKREACAPSPVHRDSRLANRGELSRDLPIISSMTRRGRGNAEIASD